MQRILAKRKNISICLLILFIGCLAWYFYPRTYHFEIPIQWSDGNTPLTKMEIEGKSYLLEIDLGSKFPISLKKNVLDGIDNKKCSGMGEWKDVQGNKYQSPAYSVSKALLGRLVLKSVVIQQEDDEWLANTTVWAAEEKSPLIEHGSIGRPLLKERNWFFDFRNSVLLASNDKNKLKLKGYNLDDFLKVPFEIGKIGITIQVETDIGTKRLAIDTGCSLNLINSSFFKNYECPNGKPGLPLFTSSRFVLQNENLGKMNFYLYDICSELSDIDGFLGISFLKDHLVYIDFENKYVYIGNTR